MKRFYLMGSLLGLVVGLTSAALAAPPKVFTATFEMTQTIKSQPPAASQGGPMAGGNMVIKSKGWIKGQQVRLEMTLPNMGQSMTQIVKDGWAYTVTGQGGFKVKLPPGAAQQSDPTQSLADPATRAKALARMKAKKVGTEKVQGVVCDVYDFTGSLQGMNLNPGNTPGGGTGKPGGNMLKGASGKLWLNHKTGTPVKIVTQMPALKVTVITEYHHFKTGVDVPDSRFALPKGVQFQDLTAMMPGMGTGTKPPKPGKK